MIYYHQLYLFCILITTLATSLHADLNDFHSTIISKKLAKYKKNLEVGTYENHDWSKVSCLPKSRYDTFLTAFIHFAKMGGKQIVQLGISPLYTASPCLANDHRENNNSNLPIKQRPNSLYFMRIASSSLIHLNPIIHTIDPDISTANRCQKIIDSFKTMQRSYVGSPIDYLNSCLSKSIDLIYIDNADITSLESSAVEQLEEAKVIVSKNILTDNGIIIINDVRNMNAMHYGDTSGLGCSKYAIPFLLCNGFEVLMDEYQMILKKRAH